MMYMLVSGTRPDGRTYENYQAYLYRYKDGKMIEGQTIPVDQYAFEQFFID
jgi:ketosteroid isomerase-like protein